VCVRSQSAEGNTGSNFGLHVGDVVPGMEIPALVPV
jgi:hypothetical protein